MAPIAVMEKGEKKMPRYFDADKIELKGISVFDQNLEVLIPLSDVRKALQMTPTADVQEVRHGRWISNDLGGYKWAYYCSECGWVDGYPFNDRHKYCPYCGAKLEDTEPEKPGETKQVEAPAEAAEEKDEERMRNPPYGEPYGGFLCATYCFFAPFAMRSFLASMLRSAKRTASIKTVETARVT